MPRSPKAARRQDRRAERRIAPVTPSAVFLANEAPDRVIVKRNTQPVLPLNQAQADYDDAIRTSSVVFGVGPAGTGKTWFAAMRAAEALERGDIERIIVTRPAVEAGEKLGFLPGDLKEKYEPYLRPFIEAFEEKFGTGHFEYLLRKKIIDPRPMGFLRGSTMKNAWVLADEMQNATKTQMKMLLTRIGENSKFIISGDPDQADISEGTSGLVDAMRRLNQISAIQTVRFTSKDVVRSGLCQAIVIAYEKH